MLSHDAPAAIDEVLDGKIVQTKSSPKLTVDSSAILCNSLFCKGSLRNVASGYAAESTCRAEWKASDYRHSHGRPLASQKFGASSGARP